MNKVKIAGKQFELDFTLATMDALEAIRGEESLNVQALVDELDDRHKLIAVLAAMIDDPAVTAEWLERHIRIGQIVRLRIAIIETITKAYAMETPEDEENHGAVVDVTLEELKKKDSGD